MARVVLDTNIVVSACLSPEGAPATIVELALLGAFTLCVSSAVLAEYREVLARSKFARQTERIEVVLEGIEDVALAVVPVGTLNISPDDEDNRLLECAQAAQADFLVTGNPKHFPTQLGETRIVIPRDFLNGLGF
jgi:putative PIN family toxin of toxin-antitoxin system